jgi:heme exporter protein D
MDFGSHAGFIFASYGLCLLTILALIAWVRFDKAHQDRSLRKLAEQGITRARPENESKNAR